VIEAAPSDDDRFTQMIGAFYEPFENRGRIKIKLMKHLFLTIALATVTQMASAQQPAASPTKVISLPLTPWDVESMTVQITVNGEPISVWETRNGPSLRYCHFDTDKPVKVQVMRKAKTLAVASNDRVHIKPEQSDAGWQFEMPPNTKVFLRGTNMFICASSPEKNAPKPGDANVLNIADAGLKPNLDSTSTKLIQKAIDDAAKGPRKIVYFPAGVYISGTLYMRDGVTLYLATGSVLRGSEEGAAWINRPGPNYLGTSAFIFFGSDQEKDGEVIGVRNAAIRGRGTIDGWGHHFRRDNVDGKPGNNPGFYEGDLTKRARLMMGMKAENCLVEGVTLRNPTFWAVHAIGCKKFDFTDVKVYANFRINNDGINYDASSDSTIDNCAMITGDDSHCLKNEYMNGIGGPNERIRMANSILTGFPLGIKLGWALHRVHDCVYENNWLVGSGFRAAFAKGVFDKSPGPKIVEMTGITLRNMVIDDSFELETGGGKKVANVDGFKIEKFRVENTIIGKSLSLTKVKGVVLKGVTVAGLKIKTKEDAASFLPDCTEVVVQE